MSKRRYPSNSSRQRRIRVRGVRHEQVDHRKLTRALVALAQAQAEADAEADARRRSGEDRKDAS